MRDMAALVTNVLVVLGLVSTCINLSNAANVTTDDDSKVTNERHRRLIPYMTFYYSRQQFGQKPNYQQLGGATSYASNSLLSNAGIPFTVKAIPYHTKLGNPISNNLYSTKIVASTGSNLYPNKLINGITSSSNIQYPTNNISPTGSTLYPNNKVASLGQFQPPPISVNPSSNLLYYPINSIASSSKTVYPTGPPNGIPQSSNFQYPSNNIALLSNVRPQTNGVATSSNGRFPSNTLHATIRYVPNNNFPARSYPTNSLLFTSSLPYSSKYSFPSSNRVTLADSLRNINTRVPFIVTNQVPAQVYSLNQPLANSYQPQSDKYTVNQTPTRDSAANQVKVEDYPINQNVASHYSADQIQAVNYPTNQNEESHYPANQVGAVDYPATQDEALQYQANPSSASDNPTSNQDQESDYPTNQNTAEDYTTNRNQATDYPTNQNTAEDYPTNQNTAEDYAANENQASDYPTNQIRTNESDEPEYPVTDKGVLQNVLTPSKTPLDHTLSQILALLQQAGKLPSDQPATTARVPVKTEDSNDDYAYYEDDDDEDIPAIKTITKLVPNKAGASQLFYPGSKGGTPGRPGIDYPILEKIPPTNFDCKEQRYKGFFGDPDTNCQVWHYCDLNGGQASFLCPNGTIFSQVGLTCDWWFNVRCDSTVQLYVLNERLYKYILPATPSFPEDYSGPIVDRYLTLKFQEKEEKRKQKELEKEKEREKELEKEQEKEQEKKLENKT